MILSNYNAQPPGCIPWATDLDRTEESNRKLWPLRLPGRDQRRNSRADPAGTERRHFDRRDDQLRPEIEENSLNGDVIRGW